MPQYRTPGTYVEETSQRPPIQPAPSGVTAFVGHTLEGPVNRIVPVRSYTEYANAFGGLAASSEVSYAVLQFFRNSGEKALIVRVPEIETGLPDLGMIASASSSFPMGLGCLESDDEFELLCVPDTVRPRTPGGTLPEFRLERVVEFWRGAIDLCRRKRAMAILDAPAAATTTTALKEIAAAVPRESGAFAAIYAPWTVIDDPLHDGQTRACPPGGSVAGLYVRTDRAEGIWKPPAGARASLRGVRALAARFTDFDGDTLNPLHINLLRDFADQGALVWGGRTLALSSEWKYVSVRRLASHVERSLGRGLDWVAFEPNDEKLWAQIRRAIGDFLDRYWRQGAFAGRTPQEAWIVQCGRQTMRQEDIDQGRCLVDVGFAPVTPAEFVNLRLEFRTQPPSGGTAGRSDAAAPPRAGG